MAKDKVENQNETTENQTEKETKAEEKSEAEKPVENSESTVNEEEAEDKSEKKVEKTPEERIAELEKENADLKDQLLRRAADFDNYRKRMLKEKQETFDYANANLLSDLLDSLDNFDRTVDAAAGVKDVKSIVDGVKMINKNLVNILESKYNLVGYGAAGDVFNPDEHEAIGRVQNPDAKESTLKEVYLKGYKIKDKVIRHAKVMVETPNE